MGLRGVSLEARGLWVDMMCFMHQAEPYGHLKVGHKDILVGVLARMVGSDVRTVERLLLELEEAGVFSRTESGTIYSRRMVRDHEIRMKRAQGGAQSAKNPNVPRLKDHPEQVQASQEGYPQAHPSAGPSDGPLPPSSAPSFGVSLSYSSSSSKIKKSVQPIDLNGHAQGFTTFWSAYPRKQGKKECLEWWSKNRPNDALLAVMLAQIEHAKRSSDWTKDGGQFIPLPKSWLRGARWEDESRASLPSKDRAASCTRRVQRDGDRFLRPCGQPVTPEQASKPSPRCPDCLAALANPKPEEMPHG